MGRSRKSAAREGTRAHKALRERGHLGRGAAAALLLHLHILVPLLIATFIYAGREQAERAAALAEEVDVGFENVPAEQLPRELPPLDDTPPPLAKLSRERVKPERREPLRERKKREDARRKPEEKLAKETPPKPEPDVVVPPLPPMPTPEAPPQPVPPKAHEKVVDLDNDKDIEAPPDAKYLAQKNNRAAVETRATQTNLEREQKGGEGSQQPEGERRDDKEVGDDKAKIADLEDQKSKLGRAAPAVVPHVEPEAPSPPEDRTPPRKSPVLTLRDASPRGHELTPETVDPSLPRDPAGMLARPTPRGAFRDDEAPHQSRGKRLKLALSAKDYEYVFGSEAKADRQFAQKERSARLGKHAQRLARVNSALENFIPEVKPGNQTALNTRAAPFAAFIARMHRNIHRLWGFGALEDWDELSSSSPFNDDSLMTTLEIALNRDGTVSKVTVVHPSKYLPYDAAAIDVVYSAGPYADPPREIRSGDGKIYVTWSFFRDGRQCATSGAEPHILNNAPRGGDLGDLDLDSRRPAPALARPTARTDGRSAAGGPAAPAAQEPAEPRSGPRRLERNLGEGSQGGGRRVVTQTVPATEGLGPGSGPGSGPKSGSGLGSGPGSGPGSGAGSGSGPGSGSTEAEGAPRSADGAAAQLGQEWFAALVRGDVEAMISRAGFPFRSAAGVVAQNRGELVRMLGALVAETPKRAAAPVTIETSAGLRKLVGKLPPGLDDGSGLLFAVTHTDGDTLILLLARAGHGPGGGQLWKAVGLVRR